jgi:hypothetical protein
MGFILNKADRMKEIDRSDETCSACERLQKTIRGGQCMDCADGVTPDAELIETAPGEYVIRPPARVKKRFCQVSACSVEINNSNYFFCDGCHKTRTVSDEDVRFTMQMPNNGNGNGKYMR